MHLEAHVGEGPEPVLLLPAAHERVERVLEAELLAEAVALAHTLAADRQVRPWIAAVRLRHSPRSGSPSARTRTSPAAPRRRSRRAPRATAKPSGAMPSSDQRQASITPEAGLKASTFEKEPAAAERVPDGREEDPGLDDDGGQRDGVAEAPAERSHQQGEPPHHHDQPDDQDRHRQRLDPEAAADHGGEHAGDEHDAQRRQHGDQRPGDEGDPRAGAAADDLLVGDQGLRGHRDRHLHVGPDRQSHQREDDVGHVAGVGGRRRLREGDRDRGEHRDRLEHQPQRAERRLLVLDLHVPPTEHPANREGCPDVAEADPAGHRNGDAQGVLDRGYGGTGDA